MHRLSAGRSTSPVRWTRPTFTFVALMPIVTGCGVHELPPPEAPAQAKPSAVVSALPPREDEGQVLFDATNGPAKVSVVVQRNMQVTVGSYVAESTATEARPLCATTPCIANLPFGTHDVLFQSKTDPTRKSIDSLTIGKEPTVFRHTMGVDVPRSTLGKLGGVSLYTGISLAAAGAILFALQSASASELDSGPKPGLTSLGGVTMGIGVLLVGVGIPAMVFGRPEKQPGASTQFPLGAAPGEGPARMQDGSL